ncbi:MAG: hypothetical protein JO034_20050, partial [Singulisphaera sp.]|nr:hypothetical protein [Singulisphaera sp.]
MSTAATVPEPVFDWKRWPESEALIENWIESALAGNAFAATLSERMPAETSTRFQDWVDHLVVSDRPGLGRRLDGLGFVRQAAMYTVGVP